MSWCGQQQTRLEFRHSNVRGTCCRIDSCSSPPPPQNDPAHLTHGQPTSFELISRQQRNEFPQHLMSLNRSIRIPNWQLASAFVLACALAGSAEPQPAPLPSATAESSATNAGPTIKFAELLYDFGKVDAG